MCLILLACIMNHLTQGNIMYTHLDIIIHTTNTVHVSGTASTVCHTVLVKGCLFS